MKQNIFRIFMLVISIMLADKAARAATEGVVEVMCRNKAKEVAFTAYQSCVTEEKTARLSDIKKRYKERMAEVKGQFQKELDDMNGKKGGAAAKPEATKSEAPKGEKAEKAGKGLAKVLPPKQGAAKAAQPIKVELEDQQAVVATTPTTGEVSEESATSAQTTVETSSEPAMVDATNE